MPSSCSYSVYGIYTLRVQDPIRAPSGVDSCLQGRLYGLRADAAANMLREIYIAKHVSKFLGTWRAHCHSTSRRNGYGPENAHERRSGRTVRSGLVVVYSASDATPVFSVQSSLAIAPGLNQNSILVSGRHCEKYRCRS